ncbi:MAG: hypothetical protein LUH15_03415 [Tannerellaceae bacterium]|nr:hypothetical protein [Tannerellaceae bacterium]
MKLNKWTLGMMASIMLFSACNKEENLGIDGISPEKTSVKIRLTSPDAGSKAEGSSINGDPIQLSDGYLFFASDNLVTKIVEISGTASSSDDNTVALSDLQGAGVTIGNVPDNSTQVILVSCAPTSNLSTALAGLSASTPVDVLNKVTANTADMGAADGTAKNVALYGKGTIDTTNDPAEVEIKVYAMASRIEIGKITGTGDIESFEVVGIYMNNFYQKASIDGTTGSDLIYYSQDNQFEEGKGVFTTNGILFDAYSTPLVAYPSKVVEPVSGDVWNYFLLPATANAQAPHIIVVLENVKLKNASDPSSPIVLTGQQYLSVKGLKLANNTEVVLQKGYVYHINNLSFSEENVDDEPEVEPFSVEVTVDLQDWEFASVNVIW